MSETINYGLYIEDDSSTNFLDWRLGMNGPNESNMIKIDKILAEKANNSLYITGSLKENEHWIGDGPYTQKISIEGLSSNQNGIISVAHGASDVQREAARRAMLSVIGQEDGALIISADGEVPEVPIPVMIVLLG